MTDTKIPRVFQLSGTCNNYPWGKKGKDSLAARLCEKTPNTGFQIKDDEFYSEMWFGDYPDFPAKVLESGEPLADVLKRHPEELLGANVVQNLDAQLPYLPKILSIAKALPLQIHPNKKLSEELHREDPDKYTDPNHKPEIAVALSKFEVFAGWKPLDEISPLFNLPILRQFVPEGTTSWSDKTLRQVARDLLVQPEDKVKELVKALNNLQGADLDALGSQRYIVELLPRLVDQYDAADPGSLVALLLMNFLVLEAGQALFIPADGIHAYLSGDIVECMARSNNVLNTGFCPAADRDSVDLFAKTLTFAAHSKDDVLLPSRRSDEGAKGKTVCYRPPIREFDMLRVDLKGEEDEVVRAQRGPSVAIVTHGRGRLVAEGKELDAAEGFIFFLAPGTEATWRAQEELQVFVTVV